MKTITSKLFPILIGIVSVCGAEIDTNTLYLVVSNHDEGAINVPSIKAGVVSFTKTQKGSFQFNEIEQIVELGETADIELKRNRKTIVAKKDDPSSLQIINTQFPKKILEYKLRTFTKTSTVFGLKNHLILYEIHPVKKGINSSVLKEKYTAKVFLFRTTDGHISETNTAFWGETIGFESFAVSDSIKYRKTGMNNKSYLPSPPDDFLSSNNQKIINRASTGDKIIYFFAIDSIGALQEKDCLWFYDRHKKIGVLTTFLPTAVHSEPSRII